MGGVPPFRIAALMRQPAFTTLQPPKRVELSHTAVRSHVGTHLYVPGARAHR